MMGDEELMATVAEAFIDDMQHQVEALKLMIDKAGPAEIGAQGHKIKGSAANVGGAALSAKAKLIEQAGKDDDLETVKKLMPEIELLFSRLKAEIAGSL